MARDVRLLGIAAAGLAALLLLFFLLDAGATGGSRTGRPLDGYVLAGNQGYWIGLFGRDGTLLKKTRLSARCEPRGACVAPDGSIFVSVWFEGGTKNLFRLSPAGVELAAYAVLGPDRPVKTVAACPGGDLVLAFQNDSRIARFSPRTGSVIWDRPTGKLPRGIAVAGDGSIWVAAKGSNSASDGSETGSLLRHSPDGTIVLQRRVPLGARGVAVDVEGNCWVAIFGQQLGVPESSDASGDDHRVFKVSPDGAILATAEVGLGPFAVACDVHGFAYVACARDQSVWKLRPDGTPDQTFGSKGRVSMSALAPHPLAAALDGEGALWVASNYAGRVEEGRPTPLVRLDAATGTMKSGFPVTFPHPVRPETLGDLCGYHLASVVDPRGDLDGDGVENRFELMTGTNPFDPESPKR